MCMHTFIYTYMLAHAYIPAYSHIYTSTYPVHILTHTESKAFNPQFLGSTTLILWVNQ